MRQCEANPGFLKEVDACFGIRDAVHAISIDDNDTKEILLKSKTIANYLTTTNYTEAQKDSETAKHYLEFVARTVGIKVQNAEALASLIVDHSGNRDFINAVGKSLNQNDAILKIALADCKAAVVLLQNENIARFLAPPQIIEIYVKHGKDGIFDEAMLGVNRSIHPAASLKTIKKWAAEQNDEVREKVKIKLESPFFKKLTKTEANAKPQDVPVYVGKPTLRDYAILGMKADATRDQILAAKRDKLIANHQDKTGKKGDSAVIAEIKSAFERVMAKVDSEREAKASYASGAQPPRAK